MQRLYLALYLTLGFSVLLLGIMGWLGVSYQYQIDYGEAPLLEQARRIGLGVSLAEIYRFPTDYPFRTPNYPPLYTILLAPTATGAAPSFLWGRLLSFGCTIIVALSVFTIVHHETREHRAALLGMLLFLAFPAVVWWSSLMRVDMLALALSVSALAILLRKPDGNVRMLIAVALLTSAILTRQTYIVSAPLAAFVLLAGYSLRRALVFALLLGLLVFVPALVLDLTSQHGLWLHLVGVYFGTSDWNFGLNIWVDNVLFLGPAMLALAGFYFWKHRPLPFVAAYTLGSCAAVVAMFKMGANVNYLLELSVALSMIAGLVFAKALQQTNKRVVIGLLALLVAQTVHFGVINTFTFQRLQWRLTEAADMRLLAGEVAAVEGNVLADDQMGLLVQQGFPILFQPFDFTQMAKRGLWDQGRLVDDIEARRFGLIIIYRYTPDFIATRWTPEMLQAIRTHYAMEQLACCEVYRPR